jgi:hypothetical protein
MVRKLVLSCMTLFVGYIALTDFAFGASNKAVPKAAQDTAKSSKTASAHGVPLYFEENQGQTDGQVRFMARGGGYTAFLIRHETVLLYHNGKPGGKDGRDAVVRMSLAGSQKSSVIRGGEPLPGIVNYLIRQRSLQVAYAHSHL